MTTIKGELAPKEINVKELVVLAVPAAFDLVATGLSMMGLVYVEVSVSQMLRGAAIVFVAFLKHFALKDKLKPYMWMGRWLGVAWWAVDSRWVDAQACAL